MWCVVSVLCVTSPFLTHPSVVCHGLDLCEPRCRVISVAKIPLAGISAPLARLYLGCCRNFWFPSLWWVWDGQQQWPGLSAGTWGKVWAEVPSSPPSITKITSGKDKQEVRAGTPSRQGKETVFKQRPERGIKSPTCFWSRGSHKWDTARKHEVSKGRCWWL